MAEKAITQQSPSARRVGMISLGCAKNQVDSEIILGHLRQQGFEIVTSLEDADTVIVNTCGFIEAAREESIETILEVASARDATGEGPRLFVAGCMANRYGEELAEAIPEIDGFISLDQLREAPALVSLGSGAPPPSSDRAHLVFDHHDPRLLVSRTHAYLKVSEGCNNPCSFCAIPVWRGRYRSRTVESLVAEAKGLEGGDVRELCLIAQDTTRYGEDLGVGRHGLVRLVETLLEETSFPWIRFLYAYPSTLDPELLHLMAAEPRFCSYLDIPLQHSHPDILRAMRRGGDGERFLRLLDEARGIVDDLSVRSTFIVGFPGETEEHFAHLQDFIEAARLDHVGAFVYSPESDTPSSALPGQVDEAVKKRRYERLLETQRGIALQRRRLLQGRTLDVLVEGLCDETDLLLQGRHQGMAPEIDGRLLINDGHAEVGEIAPVTIESAYADDLVGAIRRPSADLVELTT